MRILPSTIEPLESRIAPAVVFTPTSFQSSTTDPSTHASVHFVDTSSNSLTGTDLLIANQVGHNANSYFIKLTPGEDLRVMTTVGFTDIINVSKGTVVAFFTDPNGAANASPDAFSKLFAGELTGISLGTKVSVAIGTDVHGDIVTNYNDATGILGASSDVTGSATSLLPNLVTSLTVAGDVTGSLVAGANLSHFSSSGNLHQILTGTAANGYTFNFNGNGVGAHGSELLAVTAMAGVAGPSLSNASIGSTDSGAALVGGIHLGDGGAGAAGGSVTNLVIGNDTDGFTIQAGAGGAGTAAKTAGGAGGSLQTIVVKGPISNTTDPTPNSVLQFLAGNGGAGFGKGKGGAGGKADQIYVDYNSAKVSDPAASTLADNVLVQGGTGGAGVSSGSGGSLSNIHVLTSTPHDTSLNAVEFQLLAGNAGTASGGKGGAGGAVSSSSILDVDALTINTFPDDTLTDSPTKTLDLVQGGAGGSTTGSGAGGAGGGISTITFQGFKFQLHSGGGGSGVSGAGAGGAISGLTFMGSPAGAVATGIDIHVQDLVIATGAGGDASGGKGAAGGSISGVNVSNADFGDPLSATGGLQILAGHGGSGGKGAGGAGGAVSNVNVTDIDFNTVAHPNGNTGQVTITTGVGGPGTTGGGAGGAMSNVSLVGSRIEIKNISTGQGGTGGINAISGKGGAGGAITNVSIRSSEELVSSITTAGFLTDTTQDFSIVKVGDIVTDTTASTTAVVTYVDSADHELLLNTGGVTTGDAYTVDAISSHATNAGAASVLLDTTQDFTDVNVGDAFADHTQSSNGNVLYADVPDHVLLVSVPVNGGDTYTVDSHNSTAQDASHTLVDPNANYPASAVTVGDTTQDLTATSNSFNFLGNNVPVTSEVTAVGTHTLTVSSDISSAFTPGDAYSVVPHGSLVAGGGGDGLLKGAGGVGGSIVTSSVVAPGAVLLQAGQGGSGGATGAAGAGGSLKGATNGDGAFSSISSAALLAGNAGPAGGKSGAGGSISQASVQAFSDITLQAGDGTSGGAGGSISSSGFSGSTNGGFVPSSGNITVQAGAGGDSMVKTGGNGGSISKITGYLSDGTFNQFGGSGIFTTQFNAGAGADGISKAGTGGSIDTINLFSGGSYNVLAFMNAGDAGAATTAKTGAAGGSITNIAVGTEASTSNNPSINAGTNFNYLAAGNGGETDLAKGKGGVGGSVSHVHVNTAIGQRSGVDFGFDADGSAMGGISAGAGGIGGVSTLTGVAGSVTDISADAIASIVAGHLNQGDALQAANLVTKVDGIILNGTVAPVLTGGTFDPSQFSTANLVGGISDPTAANAATFQYTPSGPFAFGNVPIDGLIAALSLTSNKNFIPEAFVTADASGNAILVDNLNS